MSQHSGVSHQGPSTSSLNWNASGDLAGSTQTKTLSTGWSMSFQDALQNQSQSLPMGEAPDMHARFRSNIKEAEKLRQQCQDATMASAAKRRGERFDVAPIQRSIMEAKLASSFAKQALQKNDHNIASENEAPYTLGHLAVPMPHKKTLELPPLKGSVEAAVEETAPEAIVDEQAAEQEPQVVSQPSVPQGGQASSRKTDPRGSKARSTISSIGGSKLSSDRGGSKERTLSDARSTEQQLADDNAIEDAMDNPSLHESLSRQGSDSDLSSDESSDDKDWPPRAPLLRFKMQVQFSNRFQPSRDKAVLEQYNEEVNEKMLGLNSPEIHDSIIGWVNAAFEMTIKTEAQFGIGFPVILLTMLDAVYPKRVRWTDVDWGLQYKRAVQKNFSVLQIVWAEVNIEKAKEFRVENTTLRIEAMPQATVRDKLAFLRLMKRWYDKRSLNGGPMLGPKYEPMEKRREIVKKCMARGHKVKFPAWIKFEK